MVWMKRRPPAAAPSSSVAESAPTLLGDRIARLEQELAAATGGSSLCSISKAAGSVPTAKYLEGRIAVLRQLRRSIEPHGNVRSALDDLAAEWLAQLERATTGGFGRDWVAYRAGGVDELRELASQPSG